jgi:hypothetical protein
MGVTNGSLRLSRSDLSELRADAKAFEQRCRDYESPDYLEMDKAGYELLYILDPASVAYDNPDATSSVPAIADVLGGGTIIHQEVDLGYGPAKIVSDESMKSSRDEFSHLDFNECLARAASDKMSEVLMCELDEVVFREYHWEYLQTLAKFIQEAVELDMAALRY